MLRPISVLEISNSVYLNHRNDNKLVPNICRLLISEIGIVFDFLNQSIYKLVEWQCTDIEMHPMLQNNTTILATLKNDAYT